MAATMGPAARDETSPASTESSVDKKSADRAWLHEANLHKTMCELVDAMLSARPPEIYAFISDWGRRKAEAVRPRPPSSVPPTPHRGLQRMSVGSVELTLQDATADTRPGSFVEGAKLATAPPNAAITSPKNRRTSNDSVDTENPTVLAQFDEPPRSPNARDEAELAHRRDNSLSGRSMSEGGLSHNLSSTTTKVSIGVQAETLWYTPPVHPTGASSVGRGSSSSAVSRLTSIDVSAETGSVRASIVSEDVGGGMAIPLLRHRYRRDVSGVSYGLPDVESGVEDLPAQLKRIAMLSPNPDGDGRPKPQDLAVLFPPPPTTDLELASTDDEPPRPGNYGIVRKAYSNVLKRDVAVKVVPIQAHWTVDECIHLLSCQVKPQSGGGGDPRVVRCYGMYYDKDSDSLWIVMEWLTDSLERLHAKHIQAAVAPPASPPRGRLRRVDICAEPPSPQDFDDYYDDTPPPANTGNNSVGPSSTSGADPIEEPNVLEEDAKSPGQQPLVVPLKRGGKGKVSFGRRPNKAGSARKFATATGFGQQDRPSRTGSMRTASFLTSATMDHSATPHQSMFNQSGTVILPDQLSRAQLALLPRRFDEASIAHIARELLLALRHVHVAGRRVHLDVKPANLLLTSNGRAPVSPSLSSRSGSASPFSPGSMSPCGAPLSHLRVSLADFGTAQVLGTPLLQVGDFSYMAPEVYYASEPSDGTLDSGGNDGVNTSSADSWGVGCVMLQMCDGVAPFHGATGSEAFDFCRKFHVSPSLRHPTLWSPQLVHFLSLCFERDPSRRPDACQLLRHPFVGGSGVFNTSVGA